jgi:3-dehydroquinate synthase
MTLAEIRVDLGARSYDVAIGPGLIRGAGERIRRLNRAQTVAIVTDSNVAAIHLPPLVASLAEAGLHTEEVVVPPGESSKSLAQLQVVVDALLNARLERSDLVLALGGGVVGDLAGFAAAITRRGMRFVQAPTTLLAQVDASVGGKTGVNARQGKNLIGAFHQPVLVLADSTALDTLPRREFAAGYAEIVKIGLIGDAPFFAWLESNADRIFSGGPERIEAIATSVRAKARIVAADEHENAERALLNLGHTFAHALEAACGFDAARLVHGEAVAIGLVLAHEFSAMRELAPSADAERLRAHLASTGLPTRIEDIAGPALSAQELLGHMAQDKKVKAGRLTFILTRGIGQAFIAEDVARGDVLRFLQDRTEQ